MGPRARRFKNSIKRAPRKATALQDKQARSGSKTNRNKTTVLSETQQEENSTRKRSGELQHSNRATMRQLFLMFFFMAPGAVVRLARGPNPLFQEQHEEPRRLTLEEFERQQAWATLGASLSLSLSVSLSPCLWLCLLKYGNV